MKNRETRRFVRWAGRVASALVFLFTAVANLQADATAPLREPPFADRPETIDAACVVVDDHLAALNPEAQELLRWFDRLGLAEVACRKLVRVATGNWYSSSGKPPRNSYTEAFLLTDEGDQFTVLDLEQLWTSRYTRTPPGTEEYEVVGLQEVDLARYCQTLLAEDLHATAARARQLVVLARACAAQGLYGLVNDLLARASEIAGCRPADLQQVVAANLAEQMLWQAVTWFRDLSRNRQDLLAELEWIAAAFPDSEHHQRAADTADLLRHMVEEDQAHPASPAQLATLPVEEQVAELIFQLRDQNGQQRTQPGFNDIFLDPRGEESPAHRLLAIGSPAIPQLVAALGDRRLTRSVEYGRGYYFSHRVLRIGDCARMIIQKIAGRRCRPLWNAADTEELTSQEVTRLQEQTLAWWQELVRSGGENPPAEDHQDVSPLPDDILAILAAMQEAENKAAE